MLTALVTQQPQLKRTILNLIPRPTLESALQTLATAAKKLSDAYPYSGPQAPAPTFGFGASAPSPFAQPQQHQPMRESYITDRLRPHVAEFVSACTSYLPYFSYTAAPAPGKPKDKPHAMETYLFLEALTQHVYAQQPLAQSSLAQVFLQRLVEEWTAWVDGVDDVACAMPSGARFRCADAVVHQRLFVAGWRRTFGSCCYALPVLFVESSCLSVRSVLVLLRRRKVFICSLLCCSLSLPTILVVVSPAVLAVVLWTPVVSSYSLAWSCMCLRVCRCFSQCSHRLNT